MQSDTSHYWRGRRIGFYTGFVTGFVLAIITMSILILYWTGTHNILF